MDVWVVLHSVGSAFHSFISAITINQVPCTVHVAAEYWHCCCSSSSQSAWTFINWLCVQPSGIKPAEYVRSLSDQQGFHYAAKQNVHDNVFTSFSFLIFFIKVRFFTSLGKVGSALAPSSRRTVWRLPLMTAAWRAVEPFWRYA